MKKAQVYTEADLCKLLETKFDKTPREWAVFFQVRNRAGFDATRSADAVAIGLWPSRGHEIHGFEMKSARSDWLTELDNPQKAEETMACCDRIFVIASDDVVKKNELPKGWGWMAPSKGVLRVRVAAAVRKDVKDMDRSHLAALLKRAYDCVPAQVAIDKARKEGVAEGRTEIKHDRKWELEELRHDHADLKKAVAGFEKTSGVAIGDSWDSGRIGESVAAVIQLRRYGVDHLSKLDEAASDYCKDIKELTEAMRKVQRDIS